MRGEMIAVTCALGLEFQALKSGLREPREGRPAGALTLLEGTLAGHPAVLVCTGAGKTAAAAGAQLVIERYKPGALINCGTAGSLVDGLDIGDVVFADRLYQGDLGVVYDSGFAHTGTFAGARLDPLYVRGYEPDPALLRAARAAGGPTPGGSGPARFGPVVTCDQFLLSPGVRADLHSSFGAVAVDMEAAAAAHIALMHGVPFLAVKSISDRRDQELGGFEEILRYAGEGRRSHWWRRARFTALNPGWPVRFAAALPGFRKASRNAAQAAFRVVGEWGRGESL